MKRMNLGAGSMSVDSWINTDIDTDHFPQEDANHGFLNVASSSCRQIALREHWTDLDYVVANHVICQLDHHVLVHSLENIRGLLRTGGWFRLLVPDILGAYEALMEDDEEWFPQDERTGGIDAKFCTYLTWFGTQKSVFTYGYLLELLTKAGFSDVSLPLEVGQSISGLAGICDLDDRAGESLIVEARR